MTKTIQSILLQNLHNKMASNHIFSYVIFSVHLQILVKALLRYNFQVVSCNYILQKLLLLFLLILLKVLHQVVLKNE